jgi:hypothetical protein
MNEFLWLLILVDGPLLIGLAIAYFLLHRLPPIEGGMAEAQPEPRFLYLHQNARRGVI